MRGTTDTLRLLQLETSSRPRELVTIARLLHDASDRVIDDARRRSLAILVIAPNDEVFVSRVHVVFIFATMLGSAIEQTPAGGRLAITGHEVERELSVAVYAPGRPQPGSSAADDIARIHAEALGGRFWRSRAADGTLAMFVLPLYLDEN